MLMNENSKIFDELKALIFTKIFPKYFSLKNNPNLILHNICDCISILILCGICYHWENCIEQLIEEGKTSAERAYITLKAFADIENIINFNRNDEEGNDFGSFVFEK